MELYELNLHLQQRSEEICHLCECKENNHNCESYAYISYTGSLIDICISDYFQGSGQPYAAIPLPWYGTRGELREEILEQCYQEETTREAFAINDDMEAFLQ